MFDYQNVQLRSTVRFHINQVYLGALDNLIVK